MSSRALKRLEQSRKTNVNVPGENNTTSTTTTTTVTNDSAVSQQYAEESQTLASDEDVENEPLSSDKDIPQRNRFEMLTLDDEEKESDEETVEDIGSVDVTNIVIKNKKKNRKKKKRQRTVGETELDDELDTLTNEMNNDPSPSLRLSHPAMIQPTKAILTVEHRNLNPENELMRIFGSRVVRAENGRHQRNRSQGRLLRLAQPRDSWPPMTKSGLSMTLRDSAGTWQSFTFEHNQQYQAVQRQFLDAVDSMNPNNIVELLRLHPYNIDSLLQMSDLCRLSDDTPTAAELIERALYAMECAFHPLFSLTQGNSRLDYRYPENRSFMISMFRHITFVGLKGCYRTALELCKLLLSLSPDEDPLGVLLMIDFYAILSHEYSFLITLFHEWELSRNLSQLPNFAFSTPLAMFKRAKEAGALGDAADRADAMLQESLLMFPHVLLPLLDKCSMKPDNAVSSHDFFTKCLVNSEEPRAVLQLSALYVGRCHSCWKDPDVMSWLELNVHVVMALVDRHDDRVVDYQQKRRARFRGRPLNVYRHILMSDMKEATADIPLEITSSTITNYDPLPPSDSIVTYTRRPRRTRLQQDSGYFSTFLRSLLPNFNADEPAQEGGAAGGVDGNALHQGITSLLDAMRDLLHNIHPQPPPVQNHGGDDDVVEDHEWD